MFKKLRDFIKALTNDESSTLEDNSKTNSDILQGSIIERAIPEYKNKIPIRTMSLKGDDNSIQKKNDYNEIEI